MAIDLLSKPASFRAFGEGPWSLPLLHLGLQAGGQVKKGSLSEAELSQFVSTEHWYRHAINCRVFYTDGVKYVAERASAYWLLDEIAMIQLFDKRVAAEEFQVWNLKVALDMTGELQCEDGNRKVISSREIPRTDFPGSGITLWFSGNTILLPSEY